MDAILGATYKQYGSDEIPCIIKDSFSNMKIKISSGDYVSTVSNDLYNFFLNSPIWDILSMPGTGITREMRVVFRTSNWVTSFKQPTYVIWNMVRNSTYSTNLWYTYQTDATTSNITTSITLSTAQTESSISNLCSFQYQPFSGSNPSTSYAEWLLHATIEVRYTPAFTI